MNSVALIQKFKVLCIQKKVKSNPVALATFINMQGIKANNPYDETYRAIPAYSNSRLGEIRSQLLGMSRPKPYRAFGIGHMVHQLILEPEIANIKNYVFLTPAVRRDVIGMVLAAKSDPTIRQLLPRYKKEKVFTWIDDLTGLPCKCKADLFNELGGGNHVADLKTTSASSQEEFEKHAIKYEYDRQGAFYLDGTTSSRFSLYGIQKKAPYSVFKLSYTKNDDLITRGRKKYRFILSKALQNNIQP